MTVQSRSTLPYDCHRVFHPWHQDCIPAALMLSKSSFRESFKIYCVLYGVRIDCHSNSLSKQILVDLFRLPD